MKKARRYDPVRTSRISDAVWDKARERAQSEEVSMSRMINLLVTGYADKQINLPTVKLVFDNAEQG